MAKIVVNDELMRKLNSARQECDGKTMTTNELKVVLKQIGLPTSPTFISNMTKGVNPPLRKCLNGYEFNNNPIHQDMMKLIVKTYERIVTAPKPSKMTIVQSKDEIAAAITLLKAHGYKVGKPNVTYEWL